MNKLLLSCTLLSLATAGSAVSQVVYGNIMGTVTDSSGAAVPNAKITVVDASKGVTFTTTSNATGNYSQQHLIVGLYEVRVEVSGFAPFLQKNVNVEVDATTQVNANLSVGAVGEVVNVT